MNSVKLIVIYDIFNHKTCSEIIFIMRFKFFKLFLVLIFITINISVFSQQNIRIKFTKDEIIDSLKKSGVIIDEHKAKPVITLTESEALIYLRKKYHPQFWNNTNDPLRQEFARLIYEAEHLPLDSMKSALMNYPYDSLSIPWEKFYIWEPLKLKVPVLQKPSFKILTDTLVTADTNNVVAVQDSLLRPIGAVEASDISRPETALKDTTILVISDTLDHVISSYSKFPFRYFNYPYQGDSIKAAVKSLINYLDNRDSTAINFVGYGNSTTPIMLNSKTGQDTRYWLKNDMSDSVTVWIGTPSRNTIGLYLEKGVNFRRPLWQGNYANAKVNAEHVDRSTLQTIHNIALKKLYWKYRTETSFVLNQTALSNWVRGGEGSISTALDITEYADYENKDRKISSGNFARLKFGYQASGADNFRKNIDLLETNSKLNHKAFGKFDFSAILLFKTQLAKGYNYFTTASDKDTSNLVSKFFNPAILTIGLGLDFKPNKTTSINFSPLSFKGTFVTDPAYYHNIYDSTKVDQTQYGIAKNKKSLTEPGVSFMISNEFKPTEAITIVNRLQLFTNYIHNPQNVDVDWEMIFTAKLNWFTDVRFNTHLIFDDDTRTSKLDRNHKPILRPDGTEMKTARVQFKEMLGFSVFFRF